MRRSRHSISATLACALFTLTSCDSREAVPRHRSVEGCYHVRDIPVLSLSGTKFHSADGKIVGEYERGEDRAGTYLELKPAVRLRSGVAPPVMIIDKAMPAAQYVMIERYDHIYIRMPTETLGEELIELGPCSSGR